MARSSSSSSPSSPLTKRVSRAPQKFTPSSPNNALSSRGPINNRDTSPTKDRSTRSSPRQLPPSSSKGKRKTDQDSDNEDADDEQDRPSKAIKPRKSSTPASRKVKPKEKEIEQEQDEDEGEEMEEDHEEGDEALADGTLLSPTSISTRSTKGKQTSRESSRRSSAALSPVIATRKSVAASSSSARKSTSRSNPVKGSREKANKELNEKDPSSNVSTLLSTTSSDLYFQSHQSSRSKKCPTSTNLISNALGTLSSTALERVSSVTTDSNSSLPFTSSSLYSSIQLQSKKRFQTWNSLLVTGHSLIFHGIGEKSKILEGFLRERAENGEGNVCVIRGHIPGLRIETVLDWIEKAAKTIPFDEDEDGEEIAFGGLGSKVNNLLNPTSIRSLGSQHGLSNLEARALSIVKFLEFNSSQSNSFDDGSSSPPLYLLFNNMDSPALTSKNSRKVINILASSHKVRLLGNVDHWNSSLLVGAGGSVGIFDEIGLGYMIKSSSSTSHQALVSKPSYLQIHLSTYLPPTTSIQLSRPGVRLAGLPKVLIPAGGLGPTVGSNFGRRTGAAKADGTNPGNNQQSNENQFLTLEAAKHTLSPITDKALRMFRRLVEATLKKIESIENREKEKGKETDSSNPSEPTASNQSQSQASSSTVSPNMLPSLSHVLVMKLAQKEFIMQEGTLLEVLKEPLTHGLLVVREGVESSAATGSAGGKAIKLYEIRMGRRELKDLVEQVSKWPRWRYTSEMV